MGNHLDTAKALNLMGKKEPPMAMCPSCKTEPLVLTFKWPGAEFYCVVCGRTFGFLDPRPETPTPELVAHQLANKAKFKELFPDG